MTKSAKRAIKNAFMFSLSLILTVIILGGAAIYFYPSNNATTPASTERTAPKKDIKILLCDIEDNINWGITISFEEKKVSVLRLYFKENPYKTGGIPDMLKSARESFGECKKALCVTQTQLAAIIDYVGGVSIDVDSNISSICGIDAGYQVITGVCAIKILAYEKHNTALFLNIIEDVAGEWCKIINNKRNFFKLLNLTNNNISYTDYLPIQNDFNVFN